MTKKSSSVSALLKKTIAEHEKVLRENYKKMLVRFRELRKKMAA